MDTKLKKGKQIRAMVYRAVSFGLLIMTIMSASTGYRAIEEFFVNRNEQLIWGDITGVTEFQEYAGKVYNDGMVAFAGVGDDKGYPLEDSGSSSIKDQATIDFYDAVIQNNGDLLYYVYDHNFEEDEAEYGSELHTNFPNPIFSEYDGHLILPDDVKLLFFRNGPERQLTYGAYMNQAPMNFSYKPNGQKSQELDFVLAIKTEGELSGGGILQEMQNTAVLYRDQLVFLAVSVVLLFLSWIFCLATIRAGREAKKKMTDATAKVLLEIKLVVLFLILMAAFPSVAHPLTYVGERDLVRTGILGICLYPILTDFKLNAGRLFQCCIPVLAYQYAQEWGQNETWKKRLGVFAGVTGLAALLCGVFSMVFLFHLLDRIKNMADPGTLISLFSAAEPKGSAYVELMAALWFVLIGIVLLIISLRQFARFAREVGEVTDKLSDIRNGNLKEPIPVVAGAFLAKTADDVNMLESGIESAVAQKSRADRMKVELITNVSHDLKTPLTSIINYVDLLCEEDMSPAARDYCLALRDKSYKLKSMVQDVFEVSKASTGNMYVEKVILDLGKLIRQTLADMDERIAESNLTFKVNLPQEPVYIEGDGEKLYRIFQNLFVNAIQYSLDYSRVHVGLLVQEQAAVASVKNTSRGELNFDTAEIMERFVRADASRSSEGSGLGLSIAKSFAEACGGSFAIETDADMFTAIVRFPVTQKPEETEESKDLGTAEIPDMAGQNKMTE